MIDIRQYALQSLSISFVSMMVPVTRLVLDGSWELRYIDICTRSAVETGSEVKGGGGVGGGFKYCYLYYDFLVLFLVSSTRRSHSLKLKIRFLPMFNQGSKASIPSVLFYLFSFSLSASLVQKRVRYY